MPVKVRCPSCEKVLNAPDTARGKAIKCPGCETKISVPSGNGDAESGPGAGSKTAAKAKPVARKKVDDDDGDFLGRLDLSEVEDQSVRLCPKCGVELAEDVIACPACGVDARTGQVTAAHKKKAAMKGPDPIAYYPLAWTDSWKFTLANYSLVWRTAMYSLALLTVFFGCMYMSLIWCSRLPPQVFWGCFGLAAYLAVPGWFWHLSNEIVRGTMSKKDVLNRINFDIFANMALGVKTIAWQIAFFLPAVIIAAPIVYFLRESNPLAGAILSLVVFAPFILMAPLAMCHMAMPIQMKAWVSPLMFPILGRTFLPALYWWVVAIASNLLIIGALVAGVLLFGAGAQQVVISAQQESAAAAAAEAKGAQPALVAPGANAAPAASTVQWTKLIAPSLIGMGSFLVFSFTSVFNMRSLGLLAFYFSTELDLETKAKDKAYVARKPRELGPDGKPIQKAGIGQKIAGGLAAAVILYMVANVVMYFTTGRTLLPRPIAVMMNLAQPDAPAPAPDQPAPAAAGAPTPAAGQAAP